MKDDVCGTCSTNGRNDNCIWGSDGKSEEKRALRRPRHRWEDNIKNGSSSSGVQGL